MIGILGKATFRQVDRLTAGVLGIAVEAMRSFIASRAVVSAAAISYYTLFSLFPLLLLLITLTTSILKQPKVVGQIMRYTAEALPASQDLVRQNIELALDLRGPVGVLASVGLLWAGTTVFVLLADNISLAWHTAKPRNFIQGRLIGFLIVALLTGFLIFSLLTATLFSLLPQWDLNAPLWGGISLYETFSWQIASRLVPWFFIFMMFLSLYRWIPNTKVEWTEAFWGALIATTAWEIAKSGFTWYLSSGLVKYQLVYGSLGTVVAFMLWIYLSALIILFGAHVSSAVSKRNQLRHKDPTKSRRTLP